MMSSRIWGRHRLHGHGMILAMHSQRQTVFIKDEKTIFRHPIEKASRAAVVTNGGFTSLKLGKKHQRSDYYLESSVAGSRMQNSWNRRIEMGRADGTARRKS